MESPPSSPVEPVTEVLHGIPVTDPYRWLEDQESPRTREWIAAQTRYARSYLDSIPDRERIRHRIRELLHVETYDSVQKAGNRYFFRKRLVGQEQPSICEVAACRDPRYRKSPHRRQSSCPGHACKRLDGVVSGN